VTSIQPKRSIDLSVRAGYLVTPQTLVYARGGYVNQREHTTIDTTPATYYARGNQNGWMLGAGVEHALTTNVTARLEYRYTDLSEGDGKWDRHQLLAGVAYHF
jgi:outer membrane immunogenic protein